MCTGPRLTVAELPRRAVMGIVNVTPDSFSDGGLHFAIDDAIAHGRALFGAGAAIVDVGGESTRPGAERVAEAEELRRVVPVVRALAAGDARVSVDTTKAAVAAAALDAGAVMVNDVSGGSADPNMLSVVADARAAFVAMHMRGTPRTMQQEATYGDVVREVGIELRARVDGAIARGVDAAAIFADPGIGFAKTSEQSLALLRALPELAVTVGVPLVVGVSRKSFLGAVLGDGSATDRDDATLATSVWCFMQGVAMVRVHVVDASVRASALLDVLALATPEGVAA